MKKRISTRQLVESGVLLALGFILSMIKVKLAPYGGSLTLVSMLPIVILAYKYGPAWGMLCGFLHGLLQVVEGGGISPPPVQDLQSFALVFLLDYALAWSAVGLIAGLLRKISSKPKIAISIGSFFGIAGRLLCSFTSGVIIWGAYAPEGQSAVMYSLIYNGSKMGLEMLITVVVSFLMFSIPVIQKQVEPSLQRV